MVLVLISYNVMVFSPFDDGVFCSCGLIIALYKQACKLGIFHKVIIIALDKLNKKKLDPGKREEFKKVLRSL